MTSFFVRHIIGFQSCFSSHALQSLKGSQSPVRCLYLLRCCWYSSVYLQSRYHKSAALSSALPIDPCPSMTTANSSSFSQGITTFISWTTKARNLDTITCSWLFLSVLPCTYNHEVLKMSTSRYPAKSPIFLCTSVSLRNSHFLLGLFHSHLTNFLSTISHLVDILSP